MCFAIVAATVLSFVASVQFPVASVQAARARRGSMKMSSVQYTK